MNDGEALGDLLFMIEDGWRPLLNGRDLSGWHGLDATKPNAWFTTKYDFGIACSDPLDCAAAPRPETEAALQRLELGIMQSDPCFPQ